MTDPVAEPILPPVELDRLQHALSVFTAEAVADVLGPVGGAAHERGDLAGVARVIADADDSPTRTFVRLFLLGLGVPAAAARAAFAPLPLDTAVSGGVLLRVGDEVRAALEIRPYREAGDAPPWWVVSDFGSDVRPGPLDPGHVLGIGRAALTLAQATVRNPVRRALDIGTGSGVQALHLARHADHVVATDISPRALRFAATTAALSGQDWDLRQGSFLDPVADETFDLVVANPPFVISPGAAGGPAGFDYRDSGRAGDAACRDLVRQLPGRLAPGGTAQLLANWIIPREGAWQDRLADWFPDDRCDAWVWQREVAELGEYVTLWLRDAGHEPGSADWSRRYDAWLDWFEDHDVAAVGMGLINLRDAGGAGGTVVFDDVPQPVAQPVGPEIDAWFDRHRLLAGGGDPLDGRWEPAPDLVLRRDHLLGDHSAPGWSSRRATLIQPHGLRWEVEVDDAVAGLVAACAAGASPRLALEVLAATSGDDVGDLVTAFGPTLADLVRRGVLVPAATR